MCQNSLGGIGWVTYLINEINNCTKAVLGFERIIEITCVLYNIDINVVLNMDVKKKLHKKSYLVPS